MINCLRNLVVVFLAEAGRLINRITHLHEKRQFNFVRDSIDLNQCNNFPLVAFTVYSK